MWIPVFIETTEPDILGKQRRKRVSCCEKKPDFASLKLVYESKMLGNSDLSRKEHIFLALLVP